MKSQTTKRIVICIVINIILLVILYNIPTQGLNIELCIYKNITGRECYNCGMTRAFLAILHFDFLSAIKFNKNVVIVFPLTVCIYAYFWYKYIFKGVKKYERKD